MSPIAANTTSTVSRTARRKRRVMSISSGFLPSSSVGVRGSSAMPQIGQLPARSRTISGCMGQVHTAPAAGGAAGRRLCAVRRGRRAPPWVPRVARPGPARRDSAPGPRGTCRGTRRSRSGRCCPSCWWEIGLSGETVMPHTGSTLGFGHRATSIGVRRSTASSRIPGEGSSDSSIPRRSTTDSHRRPSAFT